MRAILKLIVFLVLIPVSSLKADTITSAKTTRRVASQEISYQIEIPTFNEMRPFAVIGDTQRTLEYGRVVGKEVNDLERVRLIDDLKRNHPAFLVMVGDLVGMSSESSHWKFFDDLFRPLNQAGLPILVALGNHDYLLPLFGLAMKNFEARFLPKGRDRDYRRLSADLSFNANPEKKTHFYSRKYGSLGLIWLDTNFSVRSNDWKNQKKWFEATLSEMNSDALLKGVIVFSHQPPFTNSTIVSGDEGIRNDLLPAFFASKKTLAYISGHCHSYERFFENGKTFLVSGGGGGPRQSLRAESDSKYHDFFSGGFDGNPNARVRPFHYLLLSEKASGIHIEVRAIKKQKPGAQEETPFSLEQFDLEFTEAK